MTVFIHSRTSFDNIEKKWHPEISHHWQNPKTPVPCILVGLKADIRNDAEAIKELNKKNCEPISEEEVCHDHPISAISFWTTLNV